MKERRKLYCALLVLWRETRFLARLTGQAFQWPPSNVEELS